MPYLQLPDPLMRSTKTQVTRSVKGVNEMTELLEAHTLHEDAQRTAKRHPYGGDGDQLVGEYTPLWRRRGCGEKLLLHEMDGLVRDIL